MKQYKKINKMEYIKKENMEEGWYLGFCRNARQAFWDGKEFMHLRYKFGWRWDTIEHFDDVKEIRLDGFVPVEKIEFKELNYKDINELKHRIGY